MAAVSPPAAAGDRSPPRRGRIAWLLLDCGASAYSTIAITLMVAYVERVVFADKPWGVPGGVVWAWTLGVAMLVSAVLSPLAAGWADRYAAHRRALAASVLGGSLACIMLGLVPATAPVAVVSMVGLAAVGFDLAAIFTGALLPAVFALQEQAGMALHETVRLVTRHPASAAGLHDRGSLVPNQRADLVAVRRIGGQPLAERVWSEGRCVFTAAFCHG